MGTTSRTNGTLALGTGRGIRGAAGAVGALETAAALDTQTRAAARHPSTHSTPRPPLEARRLRSHRKGRRRLAATVLWTSAAALPARADDAERDCATTPPTASQRLRWDRLDVCAWVGLAVACEGAHDGGLGRAVRWRQPQCVGRAHCVRKPDMTGDCLRSRGGPLERAAARICRDAGATVALNVRLRDLNVDVARQNIASRSSQMGWRSGVAHSSRSTPRWSPR